MLFPLSRPRTYLGRTALRRNEPFYALHGEMDNLLDHFLGRWRTQDQWPVSTSWEVEESENAVALRLPLPGFEPTEIDVQIDGNVLAVHALHEDKDNAARRREAQHRVLLPEGLDFEKTEVSYRNGMLEVNAPRLPGPTPRKFEVKA